MGDSTGISWTERTDNVVRGCSRTCASGTNQSGCGDGTGGGCYAERMAWRIVRMDRARGVPEGEGKYDGLVRMTARGPRWTGVVRLDRGDLHKLLRSRPRRPLLSFFNSMSDMFHESLPDHEIDAMYAVLLILALMDGGGMRTTQILTKRIRRAREYLTNPATQERVARAAGAMQEDGDGWFDAIAFRKEGLVHPTIWIGTSVENQEAADERIPELLATPAAVRFLSCEPLLGEVDLAKASPNARSTAEDLDWVIAGCESGARARPCDVAWLRSLRDQCAAAGVPYFLKQAVSPYREMHADPTYWVHPSVHERRDLVEGPGSKRKPGGVIELPYLDGVRHAAMPEARP